MNFIDRCISDFDKALRVIAGIGAASRPSPARQIVEPAAEHASGAPPLDAAQQRRSAALMRVNHVGEVCAQALYDAQGRFSQRDETRAQFALAGREEADHLAWTAQRVQELGSHLSLLNPLWYGGAYLFGTLAARMGDARNLGFVVETERQVEAHLAGHLRTLPEQDYKSRAIVEQMRLDEIAHGDAARALGAAEMPAPLRGAMRAASKVMTTVAYYI
ncbi:MAG: 2-octaprenyl-3-methyl-6-methoxy,4-benzoquinol hydroxylase [Herbaspirillum sp.]|jgi:ubiquinone biosynthesis monooxygenase Coq7|nr:2-octaprenyl-3-methyl-6-methoxy,4-benzoquinol hydroxylase [Herbaspirillum sp.]